MIEKTKYLVITLATVIFFGAFSLWAIVKPADDFSQSERRKLADFPDVNAAAVLSGSFMENFESYAPDQFPLRDSFRTIKALVAKYGFVRKDNNGIYEVGGQISKLDYPLNEESVSHAADRFRFVFENYLAEKNTKAYLAVIPDKNYFLAENAGYPTMDYDLLYESIYEKADFFTPIDIREEVTLNDFYKTDSHLSQEKLLPLAQTLLDGMGGKCEAQYETITIKKPFYGVYHWQSALPLEGDTIRYLTNEELENCLVYDHENGKQISVYDPEKTTGKDPYELFLSGPLSLVTIENPNAETEKELILFRDSFGSAIAPLLVEGYRKITLVDIRYLHPALLDRYIEFGSQDVLFLYSTSVLNNSETIK